MPERLENDQKLVKEVQIIQGLEFDSISLTSESPFDKENLIWGRKVQNQMFMDSIKFYWGFNWIYGGLITRKNDF